MWTPIQTAEERWVDEALDHGFECPELGCDAPALPVKMGFCPSTEAGGTSVIEEVECLAGHRLLFSPWADGNREGTDA